MENCNGYSTPYCPAHAECHDPSCRCDSHVLGMDECIEYNPDRESACDGPVQARNPGYGSRTFLRCKKHGDARVERETARPLHDSPIPPAWFDPAAAGERWNDDD